MVYKAYRKIVLVLSAKSPEINRNIRKLLMNQMEKAVPPDFVQ